MKKLKAKKFFVDSHNIRIADFLAYASFMSAFFTGVLSLAAEKDKTFAAIIVGVSFSLICFGLNMVYRFKKIKNHPSDG